MTLREKTADEIWTMFNRTIEKTEFGSLYILLDALDECDQVSRRNLVRMIELLVTSAAEAGETRGKHIKVFITAKPSIMPLVTTRKALQYSLTSEECSQAIDEDIRRIIESRIRDLVTTGICGQNDGNLLRRSLLKRAGGCVLWVSLMLDEIARQGALKSSQLGSLLDSLPDDLTSIYVRLLPQISERPELPLLKRMIGFLAVSKRPLTLEELNLLLSVEAGSTAESAIVGHYSNMRGVLTSLLGPLVKISDGRVSFIHSSIATFFSSLPESHPLFRTHGLDERTAHADLGCCCVHYLLLDAFAIDLSNSTTTSQPGDEHFTSRRTSTQSSPVSAWSDTDSDENSILGMFDYGGQDIFLEPDTVGHPTWSDVSRKSSVYDYAATFWYRHVNSAHISELSLRTIDSVRKLLSANAPHCLNWTRYAYSEASTVLPDPCSSSETLQDLQW